MPHGGSPDRRTSVGDFATTTQLKGRNTILGARLVAGSANATAQLQDGLGTVLVDLAAIAGTSDEVKIPIAFQDKVTLAAINGTGAAVNIFTA
jgi:hypothetical protein